MKLKHLFLSALLLAALLAPGTDAGAGRLEDVLERGTLRVGTTGDYRPMSYLNQETKQYEGIDAELAELIAASLGVRVEYVPTTWPTLTADTLAGKFDLALCGISRNYDRAKIMDLSDPYAVSGKTILCRAADSARFRSIEDINRPDVRVMVNPGGTNEKFARANLSGAAILIHEKNAEIPREIAEHRADVMITETVEARRYIELEPTLAAPLVDKPFTILTFGALMQKGDQDFLNYVNFFLSEIKTNGTLDALKAKYLQ